MRLSLLELGFSVFPLKTKLGRECLHLSAGGEIEADPWGLQAVNLAEMETPGSMRL